MENWSCICGKPSNEVRVFAGCDFKTRVNGPSPSAQKPETKTNYWEGAVQILDSHMGIIVMDVLEKKSTRCLATEIKTKIEQFYYLKQENGRRKRGCNK